MLDGKKIERIYKWYNKWRHRAKLPLPTGAITMDFNGAVLVDAIRRADPEREQTKLNISKVLTSPEIPLR